MKPCKTCGGTGVELSGVCHCGQSMDTHSVWDNHSAEEMTRPCPDCLPKERWKLVYRDERHFKIEDFHATFQAAELEAKTLGLVSFSIQERTNRRGWVTRLYRSPRATVNRPGPAENPNPWRLDYWEDGLHETRDYPTIEDLRTDVMLLGLEKYKVWRYVRGDLSGRWVVDHMEGIKWNETGMVPVPRRKTSRGIR